MYSLEMINENPIFQPPQWMLDEVEREPKKPLPKYLNKYTCEEIKKHYFQASPNSVAKMFFNDVLEKHIMINGYINIKNKRKGKKFEIVCEETLIDKIKLLEKYIAQWEGNKNWFCENPQNTFIGGKEISHSGLHRMKKFIKMVKDNTILNYETNLDLFQYGVSFNINNDENQVSQMGIKFVCDFNICNKKDLKFNEY